MRVNGILNRYLLLFLTLASVCSAANGYLGSDVCAGCHKDIAQTQAQTNMARTWQSLSTDQLPNKYVEKHAEGPDPAIKYIVQKASEKPQFEVQMPGQSAFEYPVEAIIGGRRHALSFLFRVNSIEGSPLPRAPLVEGRYIHSVLQNGLALELGFPEDKPQDVEAGFGRVLTPSLEKRCFGCHVAPRTLGTRVETGVACENCHGPGQAHLIALAERAKGSAAQNLGILNPKKLPVAEKMKPCSQCHAGSGQVEDPLASQLLISDQVTSLRNSECWRQTGGEITCVNCHNPHQDATQAVLEARSEKTCLSCHSQAVATHAALCPVNRTTGCVGCHLPKAIHGAFHLADHWIRVHPEQKTKLRATLRSATWQTTRTPLHLYLRQIVLDDAAKADAIRYQLSGGASFFQLAGLNSTDRSSARNGGYMGDLPTSQFDNAWAATVLKLQPGEISGVVPANGKYVIFQRMPRNFREEAEAKVDEALVLRKQGKQQESVAALLDALKIYPYFLRALSYLGIYYSQTGNAQLGSGILQFATQLYPKDQGAHFNLGIAYGALGSDREIAEYQRTIEIDPDYIPAYLNWGSALYAKGRYNDAIDMYRKAIDINPLNAPLHYSLSIALDQTGKKQEADSELALASKIDPKYAKR